MLKNLNIGLNFSMVRDTTFIFHMCIPCGKTFVSFYGTKVKAICQDQGQISSSILKKKTLTLAITFE